MSTADEKHSAAPTGIEAVVVEADDAASARELYADVLGLGGLVQVRESHAPTSGFRGFTLSLVVQQPSRVDDLMRRAVDAGATTIRPPKKSLWGYGGSFRAPDGTVWTLASASKKETPGAPAQPDELVLLLGVADVKTSKQFYVQRGLPIGKSYGKYVELDTPAAPVKLALQSRKANAKNAGVDPDGSGSSRLVVVSDLGAFTDPDGYAWEPRSA